MVDIKEMLNSPEWPQAVSQFLICDKTSEIDKITRAEGILEVIVNANLTGKKFLDFGCGEGHCVSIASKKTATSLGYDPVKQWDDSRTDLTTSWDRVIAEGPYDAILVYDVLDHAVNESGQYLEWWQELPAETLGRCKSVLKDTGRIYLQTHPWTSRHATHLYHTLNKAYAHWFFSEKELADMGYVGIPTRNNVGWPIPGYRDVIKGANLNIETYEITTSAVEPYFWNDIFLPYYEKMYKTRNRAVIEDELRQQFHTYQLKK